MGDAGLRALERDVAATGSSEARLRYAAALERAGRDAEALAVLTANPGDPALRGAAADLGVRLAAAERLPAVRRAPVVAWERKLEFPASLRGCFVSAPRAFATPSIVLCALPWGDGLAALDAATGALRWRVDLPGRPPDVVGSLVVRAEGSRDEPDRGDVVARDAWTGEVVWAVRAAGGRERGYAPGVAVELVGNVLRAFPWPDPSRPPGTEPSFVREVKGRHAAIRACTRHAVVVEGQGGRRDRHVTVLDAASGGVRLAVGPGPSCCGIEETDLLLRRVGRTGGEVDGLELHDLATGAVRWRREGRVEGVLALGARTIVANTSDPSGAAARATSRIEVLDRTSGGVRSHRPGTAWRASLSLGTVYLLGSRAITGLDAGSGATLWRRSLPDGAHGGACSLGALPGAVVTCSEDGVVTCLVEGPEA